MALFKSLVISIFKSLILLIETGFSWIKSFSQKTTCQDCYSFVFTLRQNSIQLKLFHLIEKMLSIKQWKIMKYFAIIALIGAIFQVYRWNQINIFAKFRISELRDFQEEKVNHFFSVINLPEHSNCEKTCNEYPLVGDRVGNMVIVWTIAIHKDAWQIACLLRMIYRTNKYNCIHPDATGFGKNVELLPQEKRIGVTWSN